MLRKSSELYLIKEDIMSNFDHVIDREVEKELKENRCYSKYPGWNFSGNVWFQDNKFYCEVWQYHCHVETIEGDTLEDLMENVCCEYGAD
jgi:hypothetical protein